MVDIAGQVRLAVQYQRGRLVSGYINSTNDVERTNTLGQINRLPNLGLTPDHITQFTGERGLTRDIYIPTAIDRGGDIRQFTENLTLLNQVLSPPPR